MNDMVQLVGLDFGTTTSSAVVATAQLARNALSGRCELDQVQERYRSEMVFTPLDDDRIDERRMDDYLDSWLSAGGVRPEEVFGGGALLTGLTAQRANADALVRLVRRRLGNALVATADDPCLESWLTFMGSCAPLSRRHPQTPFLNLDIGGGTTNLALGLAGEVLRTGCLYIGARHIQVMPGTYRIVKLSRYALALLEHLGISARPGDSLKANDVDAVLDWYVDLLDAAISGRTEAFTSSPLPRMHEQVPFRLTDTPGEIRVIFSGGVGELIYAHVQGKPWPGTTHFGDLGIDLARRIVSCPRLADSLQRYIPTAAGRATVYGLLRHSTEISGSTVFLPSPSPLPLTDLPIMGSLSEVSTTAQIRDVMDLLRTSARGGCVRIGFGLTDVQTVRALGTRIRQVLQETAFPSRHPLVLVVCENLGKVLGQYITQWQTFPLNLVVIDEIALRDAQYAHIGVPHQQLIPVSFYGLNQ